MNHQNISIKEFLILVDEDDSIIGYEEKHACHQGEGMLHRAFSIFLFNDRQDVLLQKRGAEKPLWPLYWSNSVCSHPRKGEQYEDAAMRRLQEELGLTTPLQFLFKFQYQAAFKDVGSEHELCSVYVGKIHEQTIHANPREIAEWKYTSIEELQQDVSLHPEQYTPWFRMEWKRIHGQYAVQIQKMLFD
jgi:isopentenyl-diphosphate delta-isomerase